ncbi:MAG: lysophospholipid acyltransferase family protein [Deltaproteobacteria bacterium]|nr:lysophospholipid acyltransferase family protein [Deltaproteobacteria bacterium]
MVKKEPGTKKPRHKKTHRVAKSIRYLIGGIVIRIFFFIPYLLLLSRALSLSKLIAKIGYYIPGGYRRQALANLRLVFRNEKSHSELSEIARKIGVDTIKGAFELAYSFSPRKGELYSSVDIEGIEHLKAALNRGKGVIALSAHLGNFTVMGGKFNSEGYPFYMVLKLPNNPGISEYLKMQMERHNVKFILADPTIVSYKEIIRCLRRNEIVCLIADGDQKVGGIPVNLMGREIAIPPGPAILARRTGAVILPMFIIRQQDDSHKIIIETPVEMGEDESPDRAVVQLTIKLTRIIESYIHQYPTQWYWVNKKHRHNRYREKLGRRP